MANKPRSGVDYLSRYVRLPDYEKLIRADCGVEKMYAFVRLIDRIGDTGGYYTSWSDEICELFACEEHYTKEDIDTVVSSAVKRNFFDREMYEKYSILTSKHLQELYIMATESRRYVVFEENYILVNFSSVKGSRKPKIKIKRNDKDIIDLVEYLSINQPSCPDTENDMSVQKADLSLTNNNLSDTNTKKTATIPQRKEKERKGNESKENKSKGNTNIYITSTAEKTARTCVCETPAAVKHRYGEYKNVMLSDDELSKIKNDFPDDWEERIECLSEYIESKGAKYKSHIATLRAWARKERASPKRSSNQQPKNDYDRFMAELAEYSRGE